MKTCAAIWTTLSALLFLAGPVSASAGCETVEFEDIPFTICRADPAVDSVELRLNDDTGALIGTFERLTDTTAAEGRDVVFAMNGGMYHPDRRPVGHYVEDGTELAPLVTRSGPGNFGLLPNGVLCLGDRTALVAETLAFAKTKPGCRDASQSGPMLVIDGALHPRFLATSNSRFIRNGVGVTRDGTLVAAISDRPVTFHHFARLFRDALNAPNALYIDGNVSRLLAPGIARADIGFPMGPMLVVTRPAD
jgi:uncharacterized protein YigE (DUF2233 family)